MKKIFVFIFLIISCLGHSQTKAKPVKKAPVKDPAKYGFWKLNSVEANDTIPEDASVIKVSFIGPSGQAPKRGVKFVCNNDSLLPPLDSQGCYAVAVDPGKYKMKYFVPYWYRIITDSVICKPKTTTNILVHFQAEDFGGQK